MKDKIKGITQQYYRYDSEHNICFKLALAFFFFFHRYCKRPCLLLLLFFNQIHLFFKSKFVFNVFTCNRTNM